MTKINAERYTNLYLSTLYATNGKPYGAGFLTIKLMKSREFTGLMIEATDGHKIITQFTCSSVKEAHKEFRRYCKLYLKD